VHLPLEENSNSVEDQVLEVDSEVDSEVDLEVALDHGQLQDGEVQVQELNLKPEQQQVVEMDQLIH